MRTFVHGTNARGAPYFTQAVTFDNTTKLEENSGNFFNDKRALINVWLKLEASPTIDRPKVQDDNGLLLKRGSAGDDWELVFYSVGSFQEARFLMTHSKSDFGWHHIMANINTNTQQVNCYFDGVAQTNLVSGPALNVFLSFGAFNAFTSLASSVSCSIADYYYTVSDDIDLSVQANREKFRSSIGKPVFLGDTGLKPTGIQPIALWKGDATVWNNTQNKGSAADLDFTMTGAVTNAASSPTD